MTPVCAPDAAQGIALRLSQYVGCEARTLGESGFQALAGGPIGTSVLSGLVTIFIALIGYRFILGSTPGIRDGIGWAARLGLVLALVTSWPAFQTLIFRVAMDGPVEVANAVLPPAGLSFDDLDARVQQAYDTIRLGTFDVDSTPAASAGPGASGQLTAAQPFKFQTPLPNTASLLVISTVGVLAALQIAIGFLLAIAPLPLMSLLFDGTSEFFSGWLRALVGAAMMMVGATVVSSVDLVMIESELGLLETYRTSMAPQVIDPQALTTIVSLFAVAMVIALIVSSRVAGALKAPKRLFRGNFKAQPSLAWTASPSLVPAQSNPEHLASRAIVHEQSRVTSVSEALVRASERERVLIAGQAADTVAGHSRFGETREPGGPTLSSAHVLTNRRHLSRRTHSAVRRDKRA